MKRILVTNDDGVHSEGIKVLADALKTLGEVTVVAPLTEASAIGHALTLRRPLRLETISDRVYAVDGTPTDCVNIAITSVLRGMPDLVVSGINKGWNLGDDVTYSGTVSGAFEAALLGPPGIAVSLQKTGQGFDFSEAARGAQIVARSVLEKGLPSRVFLNINVPQGPTKGIQGDRSGPAQSHHEGRRAHRSPRTAILLDRGRAERVGAARSLRLSGCPRWLHFGHAAPARFNSVQRHSSGRRVSAGF